MRVNYYMQCLLHVSHRAGPVQPTLHNILSLHSMSTESTYETGMGKVLESSRRGE